MANLDNAKEIGFGVVSANNISTHAPQQITKSATAPATPASGDFWYDETDFAFKFYDGSQWQLIKSAFAATGGVITESNGYRYHTFTSSGTFQVTKGSSDVEVLLVGGGGSAGWGASNCWGPGGGGAGGYVAFATPVAAISYPIVIGAGGTAASSRVYGNSGSSTTAFGQTAVGGGTGGFDLSPGYNGYSGGSGGGACWTGTAGSGTTGQGYPGGTAGKNDNGNTGGGGGGAGGAGASTGGFTANPGHGGDGLQWLDGNYYAGGGGGGYYQTYVATSGGLGGGANSNTSTGIAGTANTGGGGGAGHNGSSSAHGGSGIVIIRYPI